MICFLLFTTVLGVSLLLEASGGFGDHTGTPERAIPYLACAGRSSSVFFAGGWTNSMSITGEATQDKEADGASVWKQTGP